jgi:trigger factor
MTINVVITDTAACQKDLVIEASKDQVQEAFNAAYRELAQYAQVPGFRPGKAPASVVRQRYRREAREVVTNQLLPKLTHDALKDHDLRLVAEPKVKELVLEEGQPLTLTISVEVFPKIELGHYKGLRVEKAVRPITEEDIDRVLERVRERHVELVPIEDRAADSGDVATVKLVAQTVGSDEVREDMVDFALGSDDLMAEFTDSLKGLALGETRAFEVTYPEEYHDRDLAGQRVAYTATLEALRIRQLPDLDDEFVKTVGEDFETLAEYRQDVRRRLQEAAEADAQEEIKNTLLERLVDQHRFDVPPTQVRQRLERRMENMARLLLQQGIDPKTAELDWKQLAASEWEAASRDVRATLILQTIAQQEQIEVTDTEVDAEIARLASALRQSPFQLRQRLTKNEGLDTIKSEIRNRKALEVLAGTAEIE